MGSAMQEMQQHGVSRRRFLCVTGGMGLVASVPTLFTPRTALARGAWERSQRALALLDGAEPVTDGIVLDLPAVAEDGSTVPLLVRVDSPMAEDDYVAEVHLLSTRNPNPEIASFRLTPLAGRAEIATRIRLNETQDVVALARTSSGEWRAAAREVRVAVSGCLVGGEPGTDDNRLQARVRAPERLRSGEVGEVVSLVNHPMETGHRDDGAGGTHPRDIIDRFIARLDDATVIEGDLHPSLSANPYLRFHVAPRESAELILEWHEEEGETARASARIEVG